MAPGLPRFGLNSSTLMRCLTNRAIVTAADMAQMAAQAAQAADTDAKHSVAEKLGLWLDWTDAIALSAALHTNTARQPQRLPLGTAHATTPVIAALHRVRAELAQAIKADTPADTVDDTQADGARHDSVLDFSPYRRSYRAHQQAMQTRIGVLRNQVRAALSGLSVDLNRVAALDAVLDKALAAKERHLLSTLPSLLEKHFKRLGASPAHAAGWQAVFCADMQAALLAELDFRLHAVEGMVEAIPYPSTRPS